MKAMPYVTESWDKEHSVAQLEEYWKNMKKKERVEAGRESESGVGVGRRSVEYRQE